MHYLWRLVRRDEEEDMSYFRQLRHTIQEEREAFGEPLYSTLWCLLVGLENLERPPCDCEECKKRVREGRSPGC